MKWIREHKLISCLVAILLVLVIIFVISLSLIHIFTEIVEYLNDRNYSLY